MFFFPDTQTTDETIHKDVEEVDERINDLTRRLSQERTLNRVSPLITRSTITRRNNYPPPLRIYKTIYSRIFKQTRISRTKFPCVENAI